METFAIEAVRPMTARVRMLYRDYRLRPGGTISGPSLMTLADTGVWVALLGMIGREPLSSRRTSTSTSCASPRPPT